MRISALVAVLIAVPIGIAAIGIAACATDRRAATAGTPVDPPPFVTTLGRDHPLAGRIFDVKTHAEQTPAQLIAELREARFVLLGERHDQPDHHALQAFVVSELVASGRRPAVAFEMLHEGQEKSVMDSLAMAPRDADALARAVRWSESGWPDFALYRPIFAATLDAGLVLRAANLAPTRVRAAAMGAPDDEARALLAGAALIGGEGRARLAATIDRSHCGHAQPAMIDGMIDAQRLRDAAMARALIAADGESGDGAVLIAGTGHVAHDHGVPVQLAARAPDARVVSVAFVEVREGVTDPFAPDVANAADETLDAFDVVWFTPRLDDDDPCAKYREALEGLRRTHPAR